MTKIEWGMSSGANGNVMHGTIYTEDTFKHAKILGGDLFLVCDGHSDPLGEYSARVSDVLRDQFHIEFEKASGTPKERFEQAFQTIENKVINFTNSFSGSTAVAVYINNGMIHCANIGDSRAICFDSKRKIHFTTQDHNFDKKDELNRIKQIYGNDPEQWKSKKIENGQIKRVNGSPMSRAIGDKDWKRISSQLPKGDGAIIAIPEYTQFPITGTTYLVMATDGLWDVIDNNQVVQTICYGTKMDIGTEEKKYPAEPKTLNRHAVRRMHEALNNVKAIARGEHYNKEKDRIPLETVIKTPWNQIANAMSLSINSIQQQFFNSTPKMSEEEFNALYPLNEIPMINDLVEEQKNTNDKRLLLFARHLRDFAVEKGSRDNILVCVAKISNSDNSLHNRLTYWWHFMPRWKKSGCIYIIPVALLAVLAGIISRNLV